MAKTRTLKDPACMETQAGGAKNIMANWQQRIASLKGSGNGGDCEKIP
jgi:hypothetical protein